MGAPKYEPDAIVDGRESDLVPSHRDGSEPCKHSDNQVSDAGGVERRYEY